MITFHCLQIGLGSGGVHRRIRGVRSGFMHLPGLPAAAMVEGVAIALAAALATGEDTRAIDVVFAHRTRRGVGVTSRGSIAS